MQIVSKSKSTKPPPVRRARHTRSDHLLPAGLDVPSPPGGAIAGESGYQCDATQADCYPFVWQPSRQTLHKILLADITGGIRRSTCLATWQLSETYESSRRGPDCTSPGAAGLPVAPLLFDARAVASGEIRHAMRFILPDARMRAGRCELPATHVGAPSEPPQAPPVGARFRLRADFPLATSPNEAARTDARAKQRYGMVAADGGTVALTARSDRFTSAK
jgi:serine/threonine-protein kinase